MLSYLKVSISIILLVFVLSCGESTRQSKQTSLESNKQKSANRVDNSTKIDFTEQLSLSSKQEISFNAIREKYKQQMMSLSQKEYSDKQSLKDAIYKMRKDQFAEINEVLSEEQFVKYKELIESKS